MKERRRGFISGVLTTVIALSLVGTAAATIGSRSVQADYNNIKITLNGAQVTPTDANGNAVEPFAVNGTTYLPVRAVADALGVDVQWDGKTGTVVLSGASGISRQTVDELTFYYDLYRLADCFEHLNEEIRLLKDTIVMKSAGVATAADVETMSTIVTTYFDNYNAFAGQLIDQCTTDASINIMSALIDAQGELVQARNSIIYVTDGRIPDEYYTHYTAADNLIFQAKNDIQSMYSSIYQSIQ